MTRLFTAMVTPFDDRLQVDYGRAGDLAARLVEQGSDGLVVAGSTGEGAVLEPSERLRLLETVVARVGDRAAVVASTGSNCTAATVALTREAAGAGVHGCMVVVPYYNKPSQEGMYRHFASVADASTVPLMIYNVPGRTGANLLPSTLARLARLGNLRWVKEAGGSLDQASEYVLAVRETAVEVLSGDDSLTLPILAVGGKGVVSVASHLVAGALRRMMQAHCSGEVDEAAAIHQRLFPLFRGLFLTTNPVPVKAALALAGFAVGPPRLPLVEATAAELETLKAILADLKLLAG
ncbi:MAG TPA: 4-hydroxy-tetrahydrodipicolinate synthase [Bacillota bacterium]|nr:4-hydroxy-tetrahydrodipicolinate synthase [Bacillota bacterium]